MKRLDFAISLSLFSAVFTLYIRTLAPSLLYGDSAEFQTTAYTLGIGHPTGYPIYMLIAKLFTFLPVGEIAYRVNLFSAFSADSPGLSGCPPTLSADHRHRGQHN